MITATTATSPRSTLLIASDDPLVRRLLAHTLRAPERRLSVAATPADVLRSMSAELPDLVLMQPGSDFNAAILYQRLRSHPRTSDIPVLLVASEAGLAGFAVKPEPHHFAAKPIKLEALRVRVDQLFARLQSAETDAVDQAA